MLNILCVYAKSQTYTSTVFEHLNSFCKYSDNRWIYLDFAKFNAECIKLSGIDVVVWHYSARLPFGQLSDIGVHNLKNFNGLKVLFLQDEYDNTNLTKKIIKNAQFDLVYTVVPDVSLRIIYPQEDFPNTRFVSTLTGFVPVDLTTCIGPVLPPSKRKLLVAYRARSLPIRYGRLGQEKILIGRVVKDYCDRLGYLSDISCDDISRVYGDDWYRFVASAKAMLGTESGSNVFDWDGTLQSEINFYCRNYSGVSDEQVIRDIVAPREIEGLMNQLSPRIFEMAAAKTAMILFEGNYSGVLVPDLHYLSLKKDFSNIDEIFLRLQDDAAIDSMVSRTYTDIIESNRYSYKGFVKSFDAEIVNELKNRFFDCCKFSDFEYTLLMHGTDAPIKTRSPLPRILTNNVSSFFRPLQRFLSKNLFFIWSGVPLWMRPYLKKLFYGN